MIGIEWVYWAVILYIQQFTFLFSGRAKNSGNLKYSAIAGLFSHSSWFVANIYFVSSILAYRDSPLWVKALVCLFYVTFTISGTVSAQWIALKHLEKGTMQVGAK